MIVGSPYAVRAALPKLLAAENRFQATGPANCVNGFGGLYCSFRPLFEVQCQPGEGQAAQLFEAGQRSHSGFTIIAIEVGWPGAARTTFTAQCSHHR